MYNSTSAAFHTSPTSHGSETLQGNGPSERKWPTNAEWQAQRPYIVDLYITFSDLLWVSCQISIYLVLFHSAMHDIDSSIYFFQKALDSAVSSWSWTNPHAIRIAVLFEMELRRY